MRKIKDAMEATQNASDAVKNENAKVRRREEDQRKELDRLMKEVHRLQKIEQEHFELQIVDSNNKDLLRRKEANENSMKLQIEKLQNENLELTTERNNLLVDKKQLELRLAETRDKLNRFVSVFDFRGSSLIVYVCVCVDI